MSYYLAGRWSRRAEIESYAERLRAIGQVVRSRWLTDPDHRMSLDPDDPRINDFNANLAQHDFDDLRASDRMLYFSPGGTRGGCHVEFGLALAWKIPIEIIGPREHVFTFLPGITRFDSFEEWWFR